jgi:hypothetical protein
MRGERAACMEQAAACLSSERWRKEGHVAVLCDETSTARRPVYAVQYEDIKLHDMAQQGSLEKHGKTAATRDFEI